MKNDVFSGYHPFINMFYFVLVIGLTMFFMHPVLLGLSFMSGLAYSVYLKGNKAVRFSLLYMLPLLLITALVNPAFNHQGVTILAYLPGGNPLTLESILYGVFAAFLLISVITWFSCFSAVMTGDKFVFLFGRVIPALSLVLSMALRFVPRFIAQAKIISNAQRCVGRDVRSGGILNRAKHGIKILSILVTWALENAIDTADSMKSRGFGLPGRTSFSIFRFDRRDKKALLFLFLCGGYIVAGAGFNGFAFVFFPIMSEISFTPYVLSLFTVWLALCAMPVFINVKEGLRWKTMSSSKI